MHGNPRESIDVSEVTDFSVNQRQPSKTEPSRKKGVRRVSRPLAASKKKRVIRKLRRAASPRHREEGPTSVTRNRISEDNLGQAILVSGHPCRRLSASVFWSSAWPNSALEPRPSSHFGTSCPQARSQLSKRGEMGTGARGAPVPEVGLYVKIKRSQFRSPESRPNQGHVNFS